MADDWGCFDADPDVIKGLVYPKRKKETPAKIKEIMQKFYEAGLLFIWNQGDREYGFFVSFDNHHNYCNKTSVNSEGKRERHKRKTAEPPAYLLKAYKQKLSSNVGGSWSGLEDVGAACQKRINPNPNPKKPLVHSSSEPGEIFKKFWDLYKPLNGQSKSIAEKKFRSVVKTEAHFKRCLGALENYKAQVEYDRTRDDGYNRQFQMASTWLNQWEDWIDHELPNDKPDWIKQLERNSGNDNQGAMDSLGG